jgi:hypothetical protein
MVLFVISGLDYCAYHSYVKVVISLCHETLESDPFRILLQEAVKNINAQWENQTLSTIPALVGSIKGVFIQFTTDQLDFISTLGDKCDSMTASLDFYFAFNTNGTRCS